MWNPVEMEKIRKENPELHQAMYGLQVYGYSPSQVWAEMKEAPARTTGIFQQFRSNKDATYERHGAGALPVCERICVEEGWSLQAITAALVALVLNEEGGNESSALVRLSEVGSEVWESVISQLERGCWELYPSNEVWIRWLKDMEALSLREGEDMIYKTDLQVGCVAIDRKTLRRADQSQGMYTRPPGVMSYLGQVCSGTRNLQSVGATGGLLKEVETGLQEAAKVGIELRSTHYNQVIMLKVGVGRCVYMDIPNRVVEFGPSIDGKNWANRYGLTDGRWIRIIGRSALGLGLGDERLWGWFVGVVPGGTSLMVVPDEAWDSMVWLWERDVFLWPQIIESKGMPFSVLPGWNGSGAGRCAGNVPRDLGERREGTGIYSQPLNIAMIGSGVLSHDMTRGGIVEVYIPTLSFISRMQEIWKVMKGIKGQTEFISVTLKYMLDKVGVLCSSTQRQSTIAGRAGYIYWCSPYRGAGNIWWWRALGASIGYPVKTRDYLTIKKIQPLIQAKHLEVAGARAYQLRECGKGKGVEYAEKIPTPSVFHIWKLAYERYAGVDRRGHLLGKGRANDTQLIGRSLREAVGIKGRIPAHDRIVGKVPIPGPPPSAPGPQKGCKKSMPKYMRVAASSFRTGPSTLRWTETRGG